MSLRFIYTNWKGNVSERHVTPITIDWGSTEWHPEPQWLLHAFDLDKGAERHFALKDCKFIEENEEQDPSPYLIWSHEHSAWWGPNSRGYTTRTDHAGRYTRSEALTICASARDGWDDQGRPSEVPVREIDMAECLKLFESKLP